MTSTAKNPTLRMVLPVALGMAFGISLGAVSLANGLFPNVVSPVVATEKVAIRALGDGAGIRFQRTVQNETRCWNTARSGITEGMICRE